MHNELSTTIKLYKQNDWTVQDLYTETESKEYSACRFNLVDFTKEKKYHVIYRKAKITPKKNGQFVTFWKRKASDNLIEPFHEDDEFDFYVIDVQYNNQNGQFIFPKQALIKHGIVSTANKEGKRGFRVYPKWDTPMSKQAIKSQKWQLEFFDEFTSKNIKFLTHPHT